MTPQKKIIRSFAVEMGLYALLATGYFFLVLHFLTPWLFKLFQTNKPVYAVVSLLLIIGQGLLLEILTTRLLGLVRAKTE
jgi:hypothetical protein